MLTVWRETEKKEERKSSGNAAAAALASTEQVFHLSYRVDEGKETVGSREMKEADLAGRCLRTEAWNCLRKLSLDSSGLRAVTLCCPLHTVLVLWQGLEYHGLRQGLHHFRVPAH